MRMRDGTFDSASGLRPMSAFVVIGSVIFSVAVWLVILSGRLQAGQPSRLGSDDGNPPTFVVEDVRGNVLSISVPRFDLEMSPRSMWQAHTPDYMAERISEVLGGEPAAEELLALMLPDAEQGLITVDAWDLSVRQAQLLQEWIDSGAGIGRERLEGIAVKRLAPLRTAAAEGGDGRPRFCLLWRPAVLLSARVRAAHGYDSAWIWARRIADGIETCLRRPDMPAPATAEEREERRADVWEGLMPRGFNRVLQGLPSDRVLALRNLLADESVSPWQMRIAYERDRKYPCGEHKLFGSWGFSDPAQVVPSARGGLEFACEELLGSEEWAFIRRDPDFYEWVQDRSVRGERANGFLSFTPSSDPPVLRTTLDLELQASVRGALEKVMEEHEPAVAMAIVLDVETGSVLAVDSLEAYEIQPFVPIYHTFTPGSTFKLLTMAIALEEGVVRPTDRFDVGFGEYRLIDPENGRYRTIHEAEGSLTGEITAAEALAWSVNAGLVQIGVRIPPSVFRRYLVAVGYGAAPASTLGVEKAGYLRPLPWKYRFTHASVSFGHELTTTLWQHATALASILRGGVHRPLRVIDAVEQYDDRFELAIPKGDRVFGVETAARVRAMMMLGAREGTGRDVFREDIHMGTKTGTAQKVPNEICLHVELSQRERCERDGIPWTSERFAALKSLPKPHKSCYTSSMCLFGRLPGEEDEVMVLVVVDEPRGKEKFGSKVAGPAAMAILVEALGLTNGGFGPDDDTVAGFGESELEYGEEADDEPWRREMR